MKKTNVKYYFMILLFTLLFPLNVFASSKLNLNVNKTDLEIGDEINVTVNFPDGIEAYAFLGTLKYDENVFEKIEESSFDIDTEQMDISYSLNTNKFGILNKAGLVSDQLFSVRLKVKKDASVGNTNIALTNITYSDGENKKSLDSVNVTVSVSRDAKDGEVLPNNKENDVSDDKETVIKVFSYKPVITSLIVISVIMLVMICLVAFKYRDKKKLTGILVGIEGILLITIAVLFYLNNQKKDINNDGNKDYNDAKEIIDYLIDIEGTKKEEENNENKDNNDNNDSKYDTNGDGKVDINDAGELTEQTTEKTKVSLEEVKEKEIYVEKGEITLHFKATISPKKTNIKKVKIDNKYYNVTLKNGVYEVKIETPTKPGNHNFTITNVMLDNKKEVKSKLTFKREILKDTPFINMVNFEEEKDILSFKLNDPDNAFIEGKAVIYDDTNAELKSVSLKYENAIEYEFVEDKVYKIIVTASYDLDSKKTDDKNHYEDKEIFIHSFMMGGDYKFSLTDASITDYLQKGETPVVSFTSKNNRNATIEKATISDGNNSKDYVISKISGNNYEVELTDADTTPGKHTVTLDSVNLNTLRTFENQKDYEANELTYNILKTKPSVSHIELKDVKESKTIKVDFKLTDVDDTIKRFSITLIDSTGKIVDSKKLTKEEIMSYLSHPKSVELSYAKNTDGHYTVKFLADYELGDKYTFTDANIGQKNISIEKDIYISKIELTKTKYPVKGQKQYEISFYVYVGDSIQQEFKEVSGIDGKYTRLSAVNINGLNYVSEQQSTDIPNTYRSRVTLTVPQEAGVLTIKANKVQLEYASYYRKANNFYSVPEESITIDVLKDVPSIDNLEVKEDYENATTTFDFDVVLDETAHEGDDSFKEGNVTLGDNTQTITRGHNTVIFENIERDKNFDLIFKASYDLDSDTIEEEKDQNEQTDKEIYKVAYGLYGDNNYDDVAITNGVAISKDNDKYFEKNEKIKLKFDITGIEEELKVTPKKVMINNKEYKLKSSDESYVITLDGYSTAGEKELTISDVILSNGRRVTLKEEYSIKPVVLKDEVIIEDYKYQIEGNKIKVNFVLNDSDSSVVGQTNLKITADNNEVIYNGVYKDEYTFDKIDDVIRYYVTITTDYDRDIDTTEKSDNHYKDVKLLNEIISLDKNFIELKEMIDVSLFKSDVTSGQEKTTLVDNISVKELENNKDNYFVEVVMENMPTIRAKIKSVHEDGDDLILVLDYKYVTSENDTVSEIRINFGKIVDGHVTNEHHPSDAFRVLLDKLSRNENVTLTHNYDASTINVDGEYYVNEYSGILNGNGYRIKNLSKPLFNTLKGEVKDLTLKNIFLSSTGHGALANTASRANITNVIVENVTKPSVNDGLNGGLVGNAENSTITGSAAKNVNMKVSDKQQNGALIGKTSNTTVSNCYATGVVDGSWNYNAGLVGNGENSIFTNNYANVKVSGYVSCDFVCTYGASSTFENNISLGSGATGGFISKHKMITNNYYLTSSTTEKEGIKNITIEEVNDELFEKAHFDKKIWRIENTSYEETPTLMIEPNTVFENISNEKYDKTKETLYKNLVKLMPFYETNKIIDIAESVKESDLTTKEIAHILPVDSKNNIVTYLTTDNPKKINKIKIVFKTGEKVEYDVMFDNAYDMVASYRILDLGIDYNYNHYVINSKSQVVNNLTNYLKSLNYTDNLDILTNTDDSRIYSDYYNEVTSKNLKEFVLKFLSNSNYTNTTDNEGINNYIEREVKKDKTIEKALYTYNYFNRFYSLDVDGMMLSDFVLFSMQGFDETLTFNEITDLYFKDDNNFKTGETNTRYVSVLSGYTKLDSLAKFIEYFVTSFSDEDMDEWTKEQFKGYIVELPVDDHPEIQYTLWDHFSNEDANYRNPYGVYNFILPILTLPENSTYIISSPVQFIIGSQRTYMVNPEDPTEQAKFKKKVKSYTDRMSSYYNTAFKIIQDPKIFNDIHTYHLDKRYAYDENGSSTYQQPYSTNDPFHKNFNEVVGLWAYSDGNAAVAWGNRIDWSAEGVMDGNLIPEEGTVYEYTYQTWSHESAHNIDARLFLKNHGRRFDAGGEDYADSNLMQAFGSGDIVMNFSINFKDTDKIGSNLRPDRIDTLDEIHDYYNKLFQVVYIMDYIEAQAFLQLDSKVKAEVAVQVSYPNESKYIDDELTRYRAYQTTRYSKIDASEYDKMVLKDINDLYDNKIVIYPGISVDVTSKGSNLYGGESIFNVHWYQPNNPYGRPDSYSLKWIAYEMLGYKGYDEGYIEYYSNINSEKKEIYGNIDEKKDKKTVDYKTDEMALKKITGYDNFEDYKKARFDYVATHLEYINNAVDIDSYVQKFYDALKEDADYATKRVAELLKSNPNCSSNYWCNRSLADAKSFPNSKAVREDIFYKLKTATNDFRGDIYFKDKQQSIGSFTVVDKESE